MRNLSKTLLALLCMALCLTACAEKEVATTAAAVPTVAAGTTYTGTISALSMTSITVQTESGDVVIPLTDSTVFTRDLDADALQPPQNDDSIGGDMGTLPDGDMPQDPLDGELPPDGMGNMGGMEKPGGNGGMEKPDGNGGMGDMGNMGGMGQMGDPNDMLDSFLGEASLYSLTLGMSVTVVTDDNAQAASVTFTQSTLLP